MARILLVDDDADILRFAEAVLVHAEHTVFTADNAIQAFHFLRHNPIDLLISDVNMPRVTGFDLLRMLRVEGGYEHMSIVMLTGRKEKRSVEAAVELGVHDYIVKPVVPEILVKKVTELLVRRPPRDPHEKDFWAARVQEKGAGLVPLEMISISELGLIVRSASALAAGSPIRLDFEILKEIGVHQARFQVFVTEKRDGFFESRISFAHIDDVSLHRLRLWMSEQTAKGRVKKIAA